MVDRNVQYYGLLSELSQHIAVLDLGKNGLKKLCTSFTLTPNYCIKQ